jgi:hypothetical protein
MRQNTTTNVEGNASTIAIEDILEKVIPSEREWKVHLGTGVLYHTTRCEMCVMFMKHLGEDKEKGNVSLNATLQWLENYWLEKLEKHPFMNNGRQAVYDRGFDDSVESAEKEQERRQRKGKGRATSPERERGELKTKIAQLERKKAELTGENEWLLRHVDDLL